MASSSSAPTFKYLKLERTGDVYIITLAKPPENRLNTAFCREIISCYHHIQRTLGPNSAGAVITRGSDAKFFCTGLDLEEGERDPFANTDGFYPMLATILDFPYPTIALLTGHTFGGACPFALSHDYRVMNSKRGFFSMPPVDLGLHFHGIGALPRLKTRPQTARKILLEAHRFTGKEALEHGIVDEIAEPEEMFDVAMEMAQKWAPKAKGGVYGVLRHELYGEALDKFQSISFVHGRPTSRPALTKI